MPRSGRAHVPAARRLGVAALALAAAALVSACGSAARHRAAAAERVTPATLLDQTAGAAGQIRSGRLHLTADLVLRGIRQLGGQAIALDVSGPFARDGRGRTAVALTLALTAAQANVSAGLSVAGGGVYLGVGGQYYALGREHGPKPGEGATGVTGATGPLSGMTGPLGALGIDPARWLVSPRIVGTADVGGVMTEHLHAAVDVGAVLDDVYRLVEPALAASGHDGSSGDIGVTGDTGSSADAGATGPTGGTGASGSPGAGAGAGAALSPAVALSLLRSAITAASVDLYTGVTDHLLRRARLALAFAVPAVAAGSLGGLRGGTLDLELTVSDLGRPQDIAPPADAQPASKLFNGVLALESQFGSLAPLLKPLGARLPSALGVPESTPAPAGG